VRRAARPLSDTAPGGGARAGRPCDEVRRSRSGASGRNRRHDHVTATTLGTPAPSRRVRHRCCGGSRLGGRLGVEAVHGHFCASATSSSTASAASSIAVAGARARLAGRFSTCSAPVARGGLADADADAGEGACGGAMDRASRCCGRCRPSLILRRPGSRSSSSWTTTRRAGLDAEAAHQRATAAPIVHVRGGGRASACREADLGVTAFILLGTEASTPWRRASRATASARRCGVSRESEPGSPGRR